MLRTFVIAVKLPALGEISAIIVAQAGNPALQILLQLDFRIVFA